MKKLMALLLALSLLCTLPLPAVVFAEDSDFLIRNGELLVYSGAGGDVVIPEGVTAIGKSAFSFKDNVTSVTIPDGVTSIGDSAFYHCDNLTSVTIPGSVTFIGGSTFADCVSLTHVTIPEGVTRLEGSTFSNCTGLISINLPDSLTFIGSSTFYMCSSLTSVSIPNKVTYIRDETFKECSSLTSVDLPEKLTSIGDRAFHNCCNLTSVNIPDGVTSIGKYAFCNCNSLTSVGTIPDSVTSIGEYAFASCKSLININIPSGVTTIEYRTFGNCSSLSSVNFSSGVITIGSTAFSDCTGLTSIILPDSVASIGSLAFSDCTSLTSIILSDSVTLIKSSAFKNCSNLTNVKLSDNLLKLDTGVFSNCTALTSITIPAKVETIQSGVFETCDNLKTISFLGSAPSAFYGLPNSSSLTAYYPIDKEESYASAKKKFSKINWVAQCYHTWGDWVITKKPTATETGTAERICGNDSTHKDIKELPALTDSTVWTKGARVEPTCENTGSQEYTSDYGTVTETLSATGHAWGAWNVTKKPTATETGTAERICGNDSSHKDIKELPALTDSTVWTKGVRIEPTCENTGSQEYTSIYGTVTETLSAKGHAWGAWNVTKKPTATETGTAERICGNDSSHKDIKELPALTDSTVWTKGVRIEPTCENTGSQEYTSIYGTVTETLSAKGHAWGAWNVTKKPTATETGTAERICGNDSSHKDIKALPALTDSTVWTKGARIEPTCENAGSQEYTSDYGTVTETISATGHDWGAWTITNKPTATEDGTAERICANNSAHKDTATLPKLTDTSVWTQGARIEPTCENTGSQEYTSTYGTVTETISATGHDWGAWTITNKPTATEDGTAERICANNSAHKDTATLPKLTDTSVWTQGARIEPTCENTGSQEYTSIYGTVTETLSAMGHSFTVLQHDETKHWYKCERCEARSNEENHKGGQATKKEKAICSVCNAQYGKLLPDYALPADLKTTYGKVLSDITLPTGWKWSDPSIVPTVTNNGYEAYYAIENEADYDWTNENGYDAAAKQIKLTLTVTVEKEKQKLSFEKSSINKYTTDSAFTNELTKTAVFGAVSFSSSDESVATVDNNGLITIKGMGTTDITALAAETDNYNAASATFTLNVTRRRSSSGGGGRRGGASITITPGGAKNDGNQPGTDDWENPFIDVHESDWFYDSVKYVYINKMMNGVTSDMFAPEGNITRAMFVTVLYRMEKEPQAQASPFSDIAGGSYYERAVAWANANGIVKGVSDAEFAPDESITREQMAAMIYRYAAYKKMDLSAGESTNILSYADYSDISDYAVSAMRYAAGSGIINGMTADTLSPKGISTRAQAAAVFMRVFNLFNK